MQRFSGEQADTVPFATASLCVRTQMSTEMLLSSHATIVFTCSSSSSLMLLKTSYRLLHRHTTR